MSDNKKDVVIALGYFDSVHIGHREVIKKAKILANELSCLPVVFTFDGNLRLAVKGGEQKCVYTTKERLKLLNEIGDLSVYLAPVTKEFLGLGKFEFLDLINGLYNVKAYVFGRDFRFGNKGEGSLQDVIEYAKPRNQKVLVVEDYTFGDKKEKVSTSAIKELLALGQIQKANVLLGRNYTVDGVVFEDRKVGAKIGFPTVNLKIDSQKQHLKNGVYKGAILIDGEYKKAVVNYGARPTFGLNETLIEAHVIDFSGNLYGKDLTVRFDAFLREIKKFELVEELVSQLKQDVCSVKDTND